MSEQSFQIGDIYGIVRLHIGCPLILPAFFLTQVKALHERLEVQPARQRICLRSEQPPDGNILRLYLYRHVRLDSCQPFGQLCSVVVF